MLKYILISFLIITNVYAYTCEEMGYTKSIADCPDGGLKCPAQPEKMFCCDPCGWGFSYDESNCSADDGLYPAGYHCGGKWTECRSCTSEYKYNHDNCRSPKILAGVQCANSYTQCVYPTGIGCVPTVGYIYYADGSCHADYDDTKEPIGIIVDATKKLAISLDQQSLSFNDGTANYNMIPIVKKFSIKTDALMDIDGKNNTRIIIQFAREIGQEHFAAQHCANKKEGNKEWYLPALGELNTIYINKNAINNVLAKIPNSIQLYGEAYWSSTSRHQYQYAMWTLNFATEEMRHLYKDTKHLVRCMFSF